MLDLECEGNIVAASSALRNQSKVCFEKAGFKLAKRDARQIWPDDVP